MKILIVHNKYVEHGGEDTTVKNELQLLQHHNIPVDVAYFNNGGSKIAQLLKFLAYPFNVVSYVKMLRLINKYQPDVVHIHNFFYAASPLILWALKRKRVPMVLTVQNFRFICPSAILFNKNKLYLHSIENPHSFRPVVDKVYRNSYFLTFWLYLSNFIHFKIGTFALPNKYIFASNFSKNIFEKSIFKKYKNKFLLKYNFMERTALPEETSEREDYFVFIGRFTEEKGIRVLLEAFDESPSKLIIIGNGYLKDEVERVCNNKNNIQYLGFLQKDAILNYLKKAKALIFPSIWYEGMPLTIIEALSVGTPVIASNIGAMSEMIIDHVNGLHFEANDPVDLREKVDEMCKMKSPEYQKMLAATRENFKDRYDSENNFKLLQEIYMKLG